MRTKTPVLQDPEFVEVVHAANPEGVMILSRSKVAGPPAIVRFTVWNAVKGVLAISLIVPVVPKIGSMPDTRSPVVPEQGEVVPENAIHGLTLVIATSFPV